MGTRVSEDMAREAAEEEERRKEVKILTSFLGKDKKQKKAKQRYRGYSKREFGRM